MKRKKNKRSIFRNPIIVATSLAVASLSLYGIFDQLDEYITLVKATNDAREELFTILDKQEGLEANIALLGTDFGREARLRESFRVAKPGEGVIVVIHSDPQGVEGENEQAQNTKDKKGLIEILFGGSNDSR